MFFSSKRLCEYKADEIGAPNFSKLLVIVLISAGSCLIKFNMLSSFSISKFFS